MNKSDNIGDLVTALAKAQQEFGKAVKDSNNPAYNSKYADLGTVIDAVRPALNKHGIALVQYDAANHETQTAIVVTALHHGEQWIATSAEAPAVGHKGYNVQSLGAAWTYLRRYTLQAICGMASEDDDGNSLTGAEPKGKISIAEAERRFDERVAKQAPAPTQVATASGVKVEGDKLICTILGVQKKKTTGESPKPYMTVTFDGRIEGFNYAICWHESLWDALTAGLDKQCELKMKPFKAGDKSFNIEDVLTVGGVLYQFGKPYDPFPEA